MASIDEGSAVSVAHAQANLKEMIQRAKDVQEPIVVEQDGIPQAVIVPIPLYELLQRTGRVARFSRLSRVAGWEAE